MPMKALRCSLIAIAAASAAVAQNVPEPELGNLLVNLPTHLALAPSTLQVLFTHRFTATTSAAGPGDLYGLDSGADVGLGLAMGFGHGLEASVYRSSFFKEYESAIKWTALRQGEAFPLGVAIRLGADYRAATGVTDRWAGFAQLVVARRLGSALDLFAVPMFATDTPTLRHAGNVGLGASVHLGHAWDVALEGIPANRDVPGSTLAWAVGLTKRVRGHAFVIYFGDSRATTTDLIAGSDIPGGFKTGDVRLGFNLIRRFPE
ncbi:MAG TPA: DUF5777 family beta-barrel protein [Thermoanaerobaculaceae bacterium]|nr:DUF5777 family beta-barrel protein [Thermoanaerobaculaceae bacterium]